MAKLSKRDAAKTIGVARQTLYAYIKAGRISVAPEGTIDTAELLRAGFVLHPLNTEDRVQSGHNETPSDDPSLTYRVQALERERELLARELEDAKARERQLLELLTSQQRLLEAGQKSSWWAKWWRRR
jgi:hypothetical protein